MRLVRCLIIAALVAPPLAAPLAAIAPTGPFHAKPPDLNIPAGTKPGAIRRMIQPFGPWTLICDENLKTRKRVCNVSQTIVSAAGEMVFSWSLAANQVGAPVFIVRLPVALADDRFLQIVLGAKDSVEASVILSSCDANICLGFLPVDTRLKHQIELAAPVLVRVKTGSRVETFDTTLAGLGQAVVSLK